jgi:hypothetical protein
MEKRSVPADADKTVDICNLGMVGKKSTLFTDDNLVFHEIIKLRVQKNFVASFVQGIA